MPARKFILEFSRAPGDVLMMTGLVRDLKLTYGSQVAVDVRTKFPDVWRNNPYRTTLRTGEVLKLASDKEGLVAADRQGITMSRRGVDGERIHYARVFHKVFTSRTGLEVPCLRSKADIHLTPQEKATPRIPGRYWVIVSGGKTDMTCKWWYHHRYQEVVDELAKAGIACVQEGATPHGVTKKPTHVHPPLQNVHCVLGQTTIRDLMVNIYHAEGVICGCSLPMHIAGALDKPCVVVFGGREEPWYESYVNDYAAFGPKAEPVTVPHRVLHTLGLLSCCSSGGCWKQRVEMLHDRKKHDRSICEKPNRDHPRQAVAECMAMITSDQVVDAVLSYYREGYLPPVAPAASSIVLSSDVFTRPTTTTNNRDMPPLSSFLGGVAAPTRNSLFTPVRPATTTITPARIGIVVDASTAPTSLVRRCLTSLQPTLAGGTMKCLVISQATLGRDVLPTGYNAQIVVTDDDLPRRFSLGLRAADSEWLVWLDAASYVRNPDWLQYLIPEQPDAQAAVYGLKLQHALVALTPGRDPRQWFSDRRWHRQRVLRNRLGADAPNGDCIHYVDPRLFAVRVAMARTAQVPDVDAVGPAFGIVLGEQLHQAGYAVREAAGLERYVGLGSTPRPPVKEPLPWS